MENNKLRIILSALIVIIAVCLTTLITRSCDRAKTVEHIVEIHDTITDVEFDTVYYHNTVIEKLHTSDTIYIYRDSVYVRVDSVKADIPIYTNIVDRVFESDSSKLKIHLSITGSNVKLDTLSYNLEYRYTTITPPKKRNRLGIMVGVMGGVGIDPTTGRVVPAVGIGVGFGITTKKW